MGLLQSIAEAFYRFAKRSSTFYNSSALGAQRNRHGHPAKDPRHELGQRGEVLAAKHLKRSGYKILYRNYRAPHGGEVDIVCREGDTLVFVEVKTRRSEKYGTPGEAVNYAKERLIQRGAIAWLKLLGNPPGILFRFDIVEVRIDGSKEEINIIRNAFQLAEHYRY